MKLTVLARSIREINQRWDYWCNLVIDDTEDQD